MPSLARLDRHHFGQADEAVLGGDIGDLSPLATSPCAEAILMMRPHLRFFMPGMAARMVWNEDDRLIAMTASHFSIGKSSIVGDVLDAGIVDQDVERAEVLFGRL